jgi:hypothetical protein
MEVSSWPIAPISLLRSNYVALGVTRTSSLFLERHGELRLNTGGPRETLCGSIYFCARFA